MIKDAKKVPKTEAASKMWADKYNPYDPYWHGRGPLYKENWRDFIQMKVRENSSKNTEYLNYPPERIVKEVMRKGSINLGRETKIIKCHGKSNPAICAICPVNFRGKKMICSGPTVEKTKGGLIRSKKTYYEDEMPCCNSYDSRRFIDNIEDSKEFIAWFHQELHKHPDYEVVYYKDEIDDPETLEYMEKEIGKYK